jgi:hypothetical protein
MPARTCGIYETSRVKGAGRPGGRAQRHNRCDRHFLDDVSVWNDFLSVDLIGTTFALG